MARQRSWHVEPGCAHGMGTVQLSHVDKTWRNRTNHKKQVGATQKRILNRIKTQQKKRERTETHDGKRQLKWVHWKPKLPNGNQWHTRARSISKVNENAITTAICECAICLLPLGSSHETPTNTTVASLPNNKRCKPTQERKEAIKQKQTEENGYKQQQSIAKQMQKPPHARNPKRT